jgi:predicted RNA-binding Zn-ribbon protein involved in translation (DUF1610 family)
VAFLQARQQLATSCPECGKKTQIPGSAAISNTMPECGQQQKIKTKNEKIILRKIPTATTIIT